MLYFCMIVCYIKAFLTDSADMCFSSNDDYISDRRRELKSIIN